jgi:hypothetical protein
LRESESNRPHLPRLPDASYLRLEGTSFAIVKQLKIKDLTIIKAKFGANHPNFAFRRYEAPLTPSKSQRCDRGLGSSAVYCVSI